MLEIHILYYILLQEQKKKYSIHVIYLKKKKITLYCLEPYTRNIQTAPPMFLNYIYIYYYY